MWQNRVEVPQCIGIINLKDRISNVFQTAFKLFGQSGK